MKTHILGFPRIGARLPEDMSLSVGLVDGRNIWKNNMARALSVLRNIEKRIERDRLLIASSCSLMHSPVDLSLEIKLEPEIKSWPSRIRQHVLSCPSQKVTDTLGFAFIFSNVLLKN